MPAHARAGARARLALRGRGRRARARIQPHGGRATDPGGVPAIVCAPLSGRIFS